MTLNHPNPLYDHPSKESLTSLSDSEIISNVSSGSISMHRLESLLDDDYTRSISLRRQIISNSHTQLDISGIPYEDYDYTKVGNRCCENVIGYVPIPLGIVGPLKIDEKDYYIPLATTEGALVASTQRGCKAIMQAGGVQTILYSNGMTRGPVVSLPNIKRVLELVEWIENEANFKGLKETFESTTRFGCLKSIKATPAGCEVYIRIKAATGDAMGMNILSKGCEKMLSHLVTVFPDMDIVSLSGNYCTDKKPAMINWIDGRGKSVIASATLSESVLQETLKTTVKELVEINFKKNLKGSAMAGSIGGFNAHAANMVTALYIATGQDVAQSIVSSNCLTELVAINDGQDLRITCTMPSIEVGTVGGGTHLPAQYSCLEVMGIAGPHPTEPGKNAKQLASIVAATVLAGELSLLAALSQGALVKSHMSLNRGSAVAVPCSIN